MTLRPFSIVTVLACAFAVPALTFPAGGAPIGTGQETADQVRERRPPEPREARPEDQARPRRPDDAQARDRPRPAPRPVPRPAPRVVPRPSSRGSIVFIGGYFYDPFFGPYPWWPRPLHPYWHYPPYDLRAELRIECRDRAAAVYVDGFYAGIVDDFDGVFQRLPLPPGGHRIVLYHEGFETAEFSVYLRPGSSFTVHHEMRVLPPGVASRHPQVMAPVPAPPEGTYTAPSTAPPIAGPAPVPAAVPASVGYLELRVQPLSATVMVDGERWMSSENGWYELQLPAGAHRVDVTAPGHRPFTATVDVAADATTPLNVSLTRERTQ